MQSLVRRISIEWLQYLSIFSLLPSLYSIDGHIKTALFNSIQFQSTIFREYNLVKLTITIYSLIKVCVFVTHSINSQMTYIFSAHRRTIYRCTRAGTHTHITLTHTVQTITGDLSQFRAVKGAGREGRTFERLTPPLFFTGSESNLERGENLTRKVSPIENTVLEEM